MIKIRDARPEDATVLSAAEVEIAQTPGMLASRPHELSASSDRKKIELLNTLH